MTAATRLWQFKTKNFCVALHCETEAFPDLSFDETGETQEKIASGAWECVCFVVTVRWNGRYLADTTLGNSIYADVRDFRKEHIGAKGRYGSYFRDMVREAVSDARSELQRIKSTIPHVRAA